jgi:tetratricopeptide (TPR) repeat protein
VNAPNGTPTYSDPLRAGRRAVLGGEFLQARSELERVDPELRGSPEWQLLSAMASWRLGEFAHSRIAAMQARDQYRAVGDTDGEMRAENVAAAGAFALGDLTDAERGFSRALALADRLTDELMIGHCANNLGNVAYYLARYAAALGFYRLATVSFDNVASWKWLAGSWVNSTIVLRESGELDGARDAAERALAAAQRAGDQRIMGQALAACAETTAALGDLELAHVQAGRALALATEHHDPLGEAEALRVLCVVARASGEPDRAEREATRALAVAERVRHPWTVAEVQRELGELYRAVGRSGDAKKAYQAAAQAFDRLGAASRAEEMRARTNGE